MLKGNRKALVALGAVGVAVLVDLLTSKGLSPNLLDLLKYVVCGYFAGNGIEHLARRNQYQTEALHSAYTAAPSAEVAPVKVHLQTLEADASEEAEPEQEPAAEETSAPSQQNDEVIQVLTHMNATMTEMVAQFGIVGKQLAASHEALNAANQGIGFVVKFIQHNNEQQAGPYPR